MKSITEQTPEELKESKKYFQDLLSYAKSKGYEDDVYLYQSKLDDVEKQLIDLGESKNVKEYTAYPSANAYPELETKQTGKPSLDNAPIDYSEIMNNVSGSYPKDASELNKWKQSYAQKVAKPNIPLATIAREAGFQEKGQNFSDIVKKPEFQQFLKDMQNEQLNAERARIVDEGDAEPINKNVPIYGPISNSIGNAIASLMYPAGIEAVKTGKNYGWGDAAVETGINVAEAIPWGTPLRALSTGSKIARILGKAQPAAMAVSKVAEKVGKAPFMLGGIATNSIVPAAREGYNVVAFDKPISDAATDAAVGTAVNLGTPLVVEGALRGLTRATKNKSGGSYIADIQNAISKKRNVEDILEKKAKLYKDKGIEIDPNATDFSGEMIPETHALINKDYATDKIAARSGIIKNKEYRDLLKDLEYEGNPEALKYNRRMQDLTPDEVLFESKPGEKVGRELNFIPDEFSESVRLTGPRISYYNPETKSLSPEALKTLRKKGTKDVLSLEEVPRFMGPVSKVGNYYDLASTWGINKLGKGDYAKRVMPLPEEIQKEYIDPETRNLPKNIANETPKETLERWSKGYATIKEQQTKAYKNFYDESIKNLTGNNK